MSMEACPSFRRERSIVRPNSPGINSPRPEADVTAPTRAFRLSAHERLELSRHCPNRR